MSWQKIDSTEYPKDFTPAYPSNSNDVKVTEVFLDKDNKPFIARSEVVNFNVYYKTTDGQNVNDIIIEHDTHAFKPNTLYKLKLLNGETHGFIYREQEHVVDHYLLE